MIGATYLFPIVNKEAKKKEKKEPIVGKNYSSISCSWGVGFRLVS